MSSPSQEKISTVPRSDQYEVYALRYGATTQDKGSKYHRFQSYGEPDETVGLAFYFWLIRNNGRSILVDCGFNEERTRRRGHSLDRHPLELLSDLGITASEIDHIVLSHMHFDHIGNVDLFPNATFTVARAEYEFWTGPFSDRRFLGEAGDADETAMVAQLAVDDRLQFVDDESELFPGITVQPFRGHTPGQLVTDVTTNAGRVVLASDAAHFYEEIELDRPYWRFHDLEGMYHGFEYLRQRASEPDTAVVAGHDPLVMSRFTRVTEHCVDLTARLEV